MSRGERGLGAVEYAILVTVSIAALLATGHYIKRAAMGRFRSLQAQLGDIYVPGRTEIHETMQVRFKQQETFNPFLKSTPGDTTTWEWAQHLAREVNCDNSGQQGPDCPPPPPQPQPPPPDNGKPPAKIVMTYIQTNVDKVDIIPAFNANEVKEDLRKGLYDQ